MPLINARNVVTVVSTVPAYFNSQSNNRKWVAMILIFISAMLVFANAAPVSEDKNLELLFGNDVTGSHQTEFGDYFEGDMILTGEQKLAVSEATGARNGLRGGAKRWPDNTVIFHINEDDFNEEEVKNIKEAMADIASKSCIKFRPREEDEHAVIIEGTGNGCYSSVGHTTVDDSGETIPSQVLNLKPPSCVKLGTIVHEMLHTLGFYHMQSTYDRDDFVKIEWENIKSGTEHNFAKYNNDTVTDFGVEYDYGSVMHYPEHAFSKNGNRTIIPLKEGAEIGQREGMSESDILKLKKMYCEESNSPSEFFRE